MANTKFEFSGFMYRFLLQFLKHIQNMLLVVLEANGRSLVKKELNLPRDD